MLRILILLALAAFATPASAFSDAHTALPVNIIKDGGAECGQLETVYQFDCYRLVFRKAGDKINNWRDYDKARGALKDVERALDRIVRQNRDANKPAIRVGGQRVRAIRADAVPAAKQSFDAARDQAVTKLLRADGKAKLHYTRIAEVVGSTKVLIRSWLLGLRRQHA